MGLDKLDSELDKKPGVPLLLTFQFVNRRNTDVDLRVST